MATSTRQSSVRVAADGSVVVVQVGAEGGDLTLIGREGNEGGWQFARVTNDQSEALFGEGDVPVTAPDLTSLEWVDGWEAGLRLLDRYPWVRLYLLYVLRGSSSGCGRPLSRGWRALMQMMRNRPGKSGGGC